MNEIKHPVSVWSDISSRFLRALLEEYAGSLSVIAAVEPSNLVDPAAVMILLDARRIIEALGGTPADLGKSQGVNAAGYVRLGYLSRFNGKAEIHDWLRQQPDWSVAGNLVADGVGFQFEWRAEDLDGIPY